jgi:hypothetical protein
LAPKLRFEAQRKTQPSFLDAEINYYFREAKKKLLNNQN